MVEPLTPRELDVLRLLAQHLRYQDIAGELMMAISSVKWYAQQIYGKLGVDNRRDAVWRAQELGLLAASVTQTAAAEPRRSIHNLPRPLNRFIGREKEIGQVVELVRQNPLVTLTGSGGVGKTRLAQVVAGILAMDFQAGAWLVELSRLEDERLLLQTIAANFGLQEQPLSNLLEILTNYLREKQLLLVLDNCEHLIEACASLTEHLLKFCTRLSVLATSREKLGIAGEMIFRLPSLSLPEARDPWLPDNLLQYEAVSLFVDRAARSTAGFGLNSDNALSVAQICRRLDGIPLAIELAAARAGFLGVERLAAELDGAFHLLSGGDRTALPRQQTLRASIDWSYKLLSPPEQVLFTRLAVFSGGWSLEAAEQVCSDLAGPLLPEAVLDLLGQLANKSLLIVSSLGHQPRYHLLETIRQYAREKLQDSDSWSVVQTQHLAYFRSLAERAEPHLRAADQLSWFSRLEAELDNIRSALSWSLNGEVEEGMRLVSALMWFWHTRGPEKEGADWGDRLLKAGDLGRENDHPAAELSAASSLIRGNTLLATGHLDYYVSRIAQSTTLLEESRALFEGLGVQGQRGLAQAKLFLGILKTEPKEKYDLFSQSRDYFKGGGDLFYWAEADQWLGKFFMDRSELEQSRIYLEESMELRTSLDDVDGTATACYMLGRLFYLQGNYPEAMPMFEAALFRYQKTGNLTYLFSLFNLQGLVHMCLNNWGEAALHFRQILTKGRELGNLDQIRHGLSSLEWVALNTGDYQSARQYNQELIAISQEMNYPMGVINGKCNMITYYLLQGQDQPGLAEFKEAVKLWKDFNLIDQNPYILYSIFLDVAVRLSERKQYHPALTLFSLLNQVSAPSHFVFTDKEKTRYARCLAAAKGALSEEECRIAWDEGARIPVDQAIELAMKAME